MKMTAFPGSSDACSTLRMLAFSPVKPSLEWVVPLTVSVILTTNVIFFFWSRPSDFKSSFKPRKGHFPTVQFSERLPSPTENHSPGVKQLHARTSGPIGGHRKAPTGRSFYRHKPENAQSWKEWPLCAHMNSFKIRRAILRELRSDHQKSAQQKQPIMNIEH